MSGSSLPFGSISYFVKEFNFVLSKRKVTRNKVIDIINTIFVAQHQFDTLIAYFTNILVRQCQTGIVRNGSLLRSQDVCTVLIEILYCKAQQSIPEITVHCNILRIHLFPSNIGVANTFWYKPFIYIGNFTQDSTVLHIICTDILKSIHTVISQLTPRSTQFQVIDK